MSRRWQYKVQEIKPNTWGVLKPELLQAELDKLGALGWELVSMERVGLSAIAVFKKEA